MKLECVDSLRHIGAGYLTEDDVVVATSCFDSEELHRIIGEFRRGGDVKVTMFYPKERADTLKNPLIMFNYCHNGSDCDMPDVYEKLGCILSSNSYVPDTIRPTNGVINEILSAGTLGLAKKSDSTAGVKAPTRHELAVKNLHDISRTLDAIQDQLEFVLGGSLELSPEMKEIYLDLEYDVRKLLHVSVRQIRRFIKSLEVRE